MSEQTNETGKSNSSSNLPELEVIKGASLVNEVSHKHKDTKYTQFSKPKKGSKIFNVEKYGKVWEVEFEYWNNGEEIEVISIDGCTHVEDAFSAWFIQWVEDQCFEYMIPDTASDSYNDLYEGD